MSEQTRNGEKTTGRGPLINGIYLGDFPVLARHRLTTCRQNGHHFTFDGDYCFNCGAPWFFKRVPHSDSSTSMSPQEKP